MDQQFVDEFFETGRLRLSSFTEFAQHPDEQRLDTNEGTNILTGIGEEQTVFAVTRHGHRSYILSTSLVESPDLQAAFGTTSSFRIRDSTSFGMAVALSLPGFLEGLEGHCRYRDRRVIEREMAHLDIDKMHQDPNGLNALAAHVFKIGGAEVFFVKLTRYRPQSEYRFIWNVNYDVTGPIFVSCPDARQFCERVT